MVNKNPVFEKNYVDYLQRLKSADPARWSPVLAIDVDESLESAKIPFLGRLYTVTPECILDEQGNSPDYGICVILLKYLLMCPEGVPAETTWVHSRDFKDTVQAQSKGLSDYAAQKISSRFSGRLSLLKRGLTELGGQVLDDQYPYDLSVSLPALPRVPLLVLFNDKDEHFAAETFILYESRAHHFLDAECRVMIDWYLYDDLRRIQ